MADYNFMQPDKQKRDNARVKVNIEGEYAFESDNKFMNCQLRDIGTGGVALEGKFSFYEGDRLQLRFSLDQRPMKALIEITNVSGRKAGGRFISLTDEQYSMIQSYLNRHLMSGGTGKPFAE